jgi:hypothetical protein
MQRYLATFSRALFPWGLFVAGGRFLLDWLFHSRTAQSSISLSIIEAVAFGFLFSVVMSYISWRRQPKG